MDEAASNPYRTPFAYRRTRNQGGSEFKRNYRRRAPYRPYPGRRRYVQNIFKYIKRTKRSAKKLKIYDEQMRDILFNNKSVSRLLNGIDLENKWLDRQSNKIVVKGIKIIGYVSLGSEAKKTDVVQHVLLFIVSDNAPSDAVPTSDKIFIGVGEGNPETWIVDPDLSDRFRMLKKLRYKLIGGKEDEYVRHGIEVVDRFCHVDVWTVYKDTLLGNVESIQNGAMYLVAATLGVKECKYTLRCQVDDIKTRVVEGVSASYLTSIELALPNLFYQLRLKYGHKSVKVDKILIKYSPLCALNASRLVRINEYDWRLDGNDCLQAYFVFFGDCQCELIYYGNGYCSINDKKAPWVVKYHLEESNIKRGVTYCKMKGYLKYCTSEMPEDFVIIPPSINVMGKKYNREQVDVWHCAPSSAVPILTRFMSLCLPERRFNLLIGDFGEFGSVINERRARPSVSEIHIRRGGVGIAELDPGPFVSKAGIRKDEMERRGSVIMDPRELSIVLRNVIMSVKNSDESREVITDEK